jgi:putative cell wall-binding protein
MRDRVPSVRLVLVSLAALACIFATVANVFAAPATPSHAPSAALRAEAARTIARYSQARAAGLNAEATLPPGVKAFWLPMGTSRAAGFIPTPGAYHIYRIPAYAGQNLYVRPMLGTNGMEADLFNLDIQNGALTYVYDGGPYSVLNYTTAPYEHDGLTWNFGFYDVVVFAPEDHGGSYELEWQIGDPPVTHSTRIAGGNRYYTAASCAQVFTNPDTVVIATGLGFADALSASALCGSYDAPLLLTSPTTLSEAAKNGAESATRVFVIGGSKSVSDAVFNSLKKPGRTVERVSGGSRFETAVEIAKRVHDHEIEMGRPAPTKAFVVNGMNYPDALSVSAYAFSQRMPVLLTYPQGMPTPVKNAFGTYGIDSAVIVGGNGSVSSTLVEPQLPVTSKERIAGSNRYATSALVADHAVAEGWANWQNSSVATGKDFPDGLAAGVFTGKLGGTFLLTDPLMVTEETYMEFYDHHATLTDVGLTHRGSAPVFVWGGPNSVSGFVRGEIDDAVNGLDW